MKRKAAGGSGFDEGEQQPAARRNVVSRQGRHFLVEALEAQAEPEGLRVFQEKLARRRNVLGVSAEMSENAAGAGITP